jgi:hypothetical protein
MDNIPSKQPQILDHTSNVLTAPLVVLLVLIKITEYNVEVVKRTFS